MSLFDAVFCTAPPRSGFDMRRVAVQRLSALNSTNCFAVNEKQSSFLFLELSTSVTLHVNKEVAEKSWLKLIFKPLY